MVGKERLGMKFRPFSKIALLVLLSLIAGCTGSGDWQRLFSADPKAGVWAGAPSSPLPNDFPAELRYPNATLVGSTPGSGTQLAVSNPSVSNLNGLEGRGWEQTRWQTTDTPVAVKNFYLNLFQRSPWQLVNQTSGDGRDNLTARKNNLQVVVSLPTPSQISVPTGNTPTEFNLQYSSANPSVSAAPSPTSDLIGPVLPGNASPSPQTSPTFTDLNQAPLALQVNLQDMAKLGILTPADASRNPNLFYPNQAINRRTFARWLVLTNNRIYSDRPARQIRLASPSDSPLFRDVPSSDPDFPYIQGLAAAGYLPSSLTDSTSLQFRPNDPLSREALLQWKVPVDIRQNLPTATMDGVKQAWGFKDANRIAPEALQAVLADYQNGDLSNIRRLFGSTLLLQPKKPVTRAEAGVALWYVGVQGDGFSAQDALKSEQVQASSNPTPNDSALSNSAPNPTPGLGRSN
uniref:S-layer region-like protein, putative n=1 Tax=Cyanothece sp. (strain PCC 7425 / ATCC 29141) TaxID=395961 RepID=B8HJN2_CYAP4